MEAKVLSLILIMHFVGDFCLQSRWMGENKSKNQLAMLTHIGIYTLVMMPLGVLYALINGVLHYFTDSVSSRLSRRYYEQQKNHAFWTTIGADQMVHGLCLIWTYGLL